MKRNRDTIVKSRAAVWYEAKEYCAGEAVRILDETTADGLYVLQGSVKCNFGFVHKPVVAMDETHDRVLRAECDCAESNENGNICSHCAALIYKATGKPASVIAYDPRISLSKILGYDVKQDFTLTVKTDRLNMIDVREVEGKALCNFGFVHHPKIELDGDRLISFGCDCYQSVDSPDMCPHCRELYGIAMAGLKGPKDGGDPDEYDEEPEEMQAPEEDEEPIKFEDNGEFKIWDNMDPDENMREEPDLFKKPEFIVFTNDGEID